jgi:hypothetical protein
MHRHRDARGQPARLSRNQLVITVDLHAAVDEITAARAAIITLEELRRDGAAIANVNFNLRGVGRPRPRLGSPHDHDE